LNREGKVEDTIIVGVFNIAQNRYFEYFPEKFLDEMTARSTRRKPTTTCASWCRNSNP